LKLEEGSSDILTTTPSHNTRQCNTDVTARFLMFSLQLINKFMVKLIFAKCQILYIDFFFFIQQEKYLYFFSSKTGHMLL